MRAKAGKGRQRRERQKAGPAGCAHEGRGRRAREGRDKWGLQRPRRRQSTNKVKGEKEEDKGINGRNPSSRLGSCRRRHPPGQSSGAGRGGDGGAPQADGAVRGAAAHGA